MNKRFKYPVFSYILFLWVVFSFLSCTPEWKLARKFKNNERVAKVLILPADELILENLNYQSADYHTSIDSSALLKLIEEPDFLEYYYNSLINELDRLKINVYLEQTEVLQDTLPGMLINVAQILLEESNEKFNAEAIFSGVTHTQTLYQNCVDFHYWFEVSHIDKPDDLQILYDTEYLCDTVEGYFYQKFWTGKVLFEKEIKPVDVEDIYDKAKKTGVKHARMFFDILMNRYIEDHYPKNKQPDFLLHYNAEREFLEPLNPETDLFEVIED